MEKIKTTKNKKSNVYLTWIILGMVVGILLECLLTVTLYPPVRIVLQAISTEVASTEGEECEVLPLRSEVYTQCEWRTYVSRSTQLWFWS